MRNFLPILAFLISIPFVAHAEYIPSSFLFDRSLVVSSTSESNAYISGISIIVSAPVMGDLSAVGGSVVSTAPISGDGLFVGGSIDSSGRVNGDLRIFGGNIRIDEPIAGDLIAFGLSVQDSGRASGSVFVGAIDAAILNGASGNVSIYGDSVSLAGEFSGDVNVVANARLTIASSTMIRGTLSYKSPEAIVLPSSVVVVGGIKFTKASYLPDAGTSRIIGFISVGIFLLVRILGLLILAGLFSGLFPRFADVFVTHVYEKSPRNILLTTLLGFSIFVATSALIPLLLITFVGFGLALLLFILCALLVFLACIYSGILVGGIVVRSFMNRETMRWHDGVLGMLVLSIIIFVPILGTLAVALIFLFSAGALLQLFFEFAFSREEQIAEIE